MAVHAPRAQQYRAHVRRRRGAGTRTTHLAGLHSGVSVHAGRDCVALRRTISGLVTALWRTVPGLAGRRQEKYYGSVANQSHVIFDYRDTFKNAHDELVKEVVEFVKTGKISGFAELFQTHVRRIKIKSLTTDKIKEIHAANLTLFSKLAEEVNERLLLEEIDKI